MYPSDERNTCLIQIKGVYSNTISSIALKLGRHMESKNMMPLLYDLPLFSALGGLPAPEYIDFLWRFVFAVQSR